MRVREPLITGNFNSYTCQLDGSYITKTPPATHRGTTRELWGNVIKDIIQIRNIVCEGLFSFLFF